MLGKFLGMDSIGIMGRYDGVGLIGFEGMGLFLVIVGNL